MRKCFFYCPCIGPRSAKRTARSAPATLCPLIPPLRSDSQPKEPSPRLIKRQPSGCLRLKTNSFTKWVCLFLCARASACRARSRSRGSRSGPSEQATFDDTSAFRPRLSPGLNGKFIQTYLFFALSSARFLRGISLNRSIAKRRLPRKSLHSSTRAQITDRTF